MPTQLVLCVNLPETDRDSFSGLQDNKSLLDATVNESVRPELVQRVVSLHGVSLTTWRGG